MKFHPEEVQFIAEFVKELKETFAEKLEELLGTQEVDKNTNWWRNADTRYHLRKIICLN